MRTSALVILLLVFFVSMLLGLGIIPGPFMTPSEPCPISKGIGASDGLSLSGRILSWLTPYLGFLALPTLVAGAVAFVAALIMVVCAIWALAHAGRASSHAPRARCPSCGMPISERSRTCPRCGTPLIGSRPTVGTGEEETRGFP